MIPFSSLVSKQIRFSIQSLNDSNFDSVFRELCQFVEYGCEGSILLLQTCFDLIMFHKGDVHRKKLKPDLLAAVLRYLLEQPNFSTVLCEAVKTLMISERFLQDFCDALHLSVSEKISVSLALEDSENFDIRMSGKSFCMGQIEELWKDPAIVHSSEQIQNIIMFLYRSEGLVKHVDSFMQILTSMELKERIPLTLAPLLPDELCEARTRDLFNGCWENDIDSILGEMENETCMPDIMKELGSWCTIDASHCKEVISLLSPLTEATVARVLGTLSCTHTGLDCNKDFYSTFCAAIGSNTLPETLRTGSWNVDVLVDSIKQLVPEINWVLVMENLDHEGFYLPNEEAFIFFMSAYSRACQDPFPLHAICGSVWKNIKGQISFLRYAVSSPPEIFTFAHSPRRLAYANEMLNHELSQGQGNDAWLSLDLVEVLCLLAERGHTGSVRAILEFPLKYCPEVLLLGIAQINTAYDLLQCEIFSTVLPVIVGDGFRNGMILQLWHSNPKLVLHGFVEMINADQDNMILIANICQELKILSSLLEQMPFCLSMRLAVLSCQKGYIVLEKWLDDNLSTHKDIFFEACIKFLNEIQFVAPKDVIVKAFQPSGVVNIYANISSTFIKALEANTKLITSEKLSEELQMLQKASMDGGMGSQKASSNSSTSSGNDIEAETEGYFQQLFSGELTTDAMIQMLARFKDSSLRREQLVYEAFIQNLFEEYQFFSRYPDMELNIAAILVGSLVKHRLVTHVTLGLAIRTVLDALRKPTDTKIFTFGTVALEQFVDRLVEWPQYCNHILQISHLRSAHPELVAFVESTLARLSSGHMESNGGNSASMENVEVPDSSGQLSTSSTTLTEKSLSASFDMQQRNQDILGGSHRVSGTSTSYLKPLQPSAGNPSNVALIDVTTSQKTQTASSQNSAVVPATVSSSGFLHSSRGITSSSILRQHSHTTGFGSALNIETLVAAAERKDTQIEAPESDIQDKILFLINNISTSNVEAKAKEFTEILSEDYYSWFAQYLVMKRASIEPNFHDLYLKFLDKVDSKPLNREIVKAAYENCKVLLRSELIKSSSEERSLLKNLGSWLGKFTIGRNQVLRAREIDPKSLIIEAYEKGLMIAVIPFTSKILEPCQCSLAYRPPNPWTMAVLGLLSEIYALPNLKMNIKFDIEVLFKNLGVDMKEVKPASLLKGRIREVEGNPDFSNKDVGASQPPMVAEINSGIMPTLNQVELQPEIVNLSHRGGHLNLLPQYTGNLLLESDPLMDDEKMATLSLSDQLPSGQGLSQVASLQSPNSVGQLSSPIQDILNHAKFNPKLSVMGLQYFQRFIPLAVERAVKEVMPAVVLRSVAIACRTTRELVLKDYAMESDENRIYSAAHLMVTSLAGNLAHVTCKEPLRSNIVSQLRTSLQGFNTNNDFHEQVIAIVLNDNLDLGCAVIQNTATDKALKTIDNEIAAQLSLRRKHREAVGASYYDASMYTQGPMGVLPESLRPRPGHLSLSQQQVYEDFVRFPWQSQSEQSSNMVAAGLPVSSSGSLGPTASCAYVSPTGQHSPGLSSSGIGATGLSAVAQSIHPLSEEMNPSSAQLLHGSSSRIGDGVISPGSKLVNVASSLVAAASESHCVEASNSVKEIEAAAVSLPETSTMEHLGTGISEPLLTTGDALEKYQSVAQKLESLITKDTGEAEVQGIIAQIPEILLKCISRDEAALAVAQKVFKSLYENASNTLHVPAHLAILAAIRDVCKLVVKELTSWVIYSNEDRKFNTEIIVGLVRKELLNLAEYNMHMAKLIDAGRNKAATEFSISLLQTLLVHESRTSVSELPNLVEALAKLATRPGSSEFLQQLIEIAKNPSASTIVLSGYSAGKDDRAKQPIEKVSDYSTTSREDFTNAESGGTDSAGFREQVSVLFAEWYRIYELHGTNDAACAQFISQLKQSGYLNGDEISDRFFRNLTELSVAHCVSTEGNSSRSFSLQLPQASQNVSFLAIDVYAKLVVLIMKYFVAERGAAALQLLPKLLFVTVRTIQRDAEEKNASFNSRPYFRLFINWIFDLLSPDPILDNVHFQVLVDFSKAFHMLQPLKVPAFSFAWLELVSHRSFMPKILNESLPKGWPHFHRLLIDLFKFMEPYLRNAELREPIQFLYKGTLRVLLVLLHDFPEFLCDYHFSFCDVVPSSCVQLRNVILSAFPRNMRLPDPSTPNLKIDLLAEINQSPRIFSSVDGVLKAEQMKSEVDDYLKTRQEGSFLLELKNRLLLAQNEAEQVGTRYNIPLINSLVLYVGIQTIQQLQARTPPPLAQQMMVHSGSMEYLMGAAMDIFQTLVTDLDSEGRYLFLNAIANQLRYPNNHTHFFSFVLLYLFVEARQVVKEMVQEQITRVLLERLIVNRPHPWGLLITFIELIKNPKYNFWSRSFTRCAPEIEKLFESVSRSCGGTKAVDESMMSGGLPDSMR